MKQFELRERDFVVFDNPLGAGRVRGILLQTDDGNVCNVWRYDTIGKALLQVRLEHVSTDPFADSIDILDQL